MKPTPSILFEINTPPPRGGLMEDLLYLQWNPRTVSFVPTKKIVYFLQNNFAEYGHSPLSDRQARFTVLHPRGLSKYLDRIVPAP